MPRDVSVAGTHSIFQHGRITSNVAGWRPDAVGQNNCRVDPHVGAAQEPVATVKPSPLENHGRNEQTHPDDHKIGPPADSHTPTFA